MEFNNVSFNGGFYIVPPLPTLTVDYLVVAGGGGGGGGAGGQQGSMPGNGSAGGSGVVIFRYEDSYPAATSTTGSPTITVSGGYRTYKFTASGSITF